MNKLDERNDKQTSSHARFKREIGSPVTKEIPSSAKPWMLKEPRTNEQECNSNEKEQSEDAADEGQTDTPEQTDAIPDGYDSDSMFSSDSAVST